MKSIDPKTLKVSALHGILLGAVAPRPIAFASTINKAGQINLSPFSFFNVFSANPPILIFSPARRGRDNTTKHTLENVHEVAEVAINIVSYEMVQQMSLSSTEYPQEVNEFEKAGFSQEKSTLIQPPFVKEAPVAFECKVNDVVALGSEGGAGNLVICEVVRIHLDEKILDGDGKIDPTLLDAVARMGGDWYCRANGDALFEVPKPLQRLGIGVDQIPEALKNHPELSGNDLGLLGNIEALPDKEECLSVLASLTVKNNGAVPSTEAMFNMGKDLLEQGEIRDAWCVLLSTLEQ